MMKKSELLKIEQYFDNLEANNFCKDFLSGGYKKYVFGRNEYGESIAQFVELDGFIDDFTEDLFYHGIPIVKTNNVPKDALVVSSLLGRPWAAKHRLDEFKLRNVDYFCFYRYSKLNIAPVRFWEEFRLDFESNRERYEWIFQLLEDEESKNLLNKIINFRLSYDLKYMLGSKDRQRQQYFEDFLNLKTDSEIFVDVGGFDGNTSAEFIARCPSYRTIHVFEPEPKNMKTVMERLSSFPRIHYHLAGLANASNILRFKAQGSMSRVSDAGDIEIKVDRLDNMIPDEEFTFLKMDIEGAEVPAIQGAVQSILNNHPRLAISVYHRSDDLWRIPDLVLSIRKDYRIFLRHYTEGIDETVMFFIPQERSSGVS